MQDYKTVRDNFEEELEGQLMRFDLEAQAVYQDEGIGSYEFWGSPGVDIDYQWSIDESGEIEIDIENVYDSEGDEIEITKAHTKAISKWIDENPEKVYEQLLNKCH